jgi:hypothetical protein
MIRRFPASWARSELFRCGVLCLPNERRFLELAVSDKTPIARQHHFVPQCYLKGFAADRKKPKLFVVGIHEKRSFIVPPSKIGVERDFHRIDAPGQPLDAFEKMFSGFESELSFALEKIITSRSIQNEQDRVYLFNFIGLLCVKTPRMREHIRQAYEQFSKITLGMMAAHPQAWEAEMERAKREGTMDADADTESIRRCILNNEFGFGVSTSGHLQIEFKMLYSILLYTFNRKWILCKAPQGITGFVTSDNPMCLMWADAEKRNDSPGLGRRGTHIVFSISNELALIGGFELKDGEIDADETLVAQINGDIILHSNRQIYARDSDFRYRMRHHDKVMRGADLLHDEPVLRKVGEEEAASSSGDSEHATLLFRAFPIPKLG